MSAERPAARERLRLLTEAAERELHGSSILRGHVELRGLTVMEARELLADLDGEWLNGYCPGCGKPTSSMGHKCPERGEA